MFMFSLPKAEARDLISDGQPAKVKINGVERLIRYDGTRFTWTNEDGEQRRKLVQTTGTRSLTTFVCDDDDDDPIDIIQPNLSDVHIGAADGR